jgi:hypothetical protein
VGPPAIERKWRTHRIRGVNWGGGAFDPKNGLYIVNAMNAAHVPARRSTAARVPQGG